MSRHPKTCQEGYGELEHEGRDMGRESNKTEVKDLSAKHIMIENIVQHPFQRQIEAAAGTITKQLQAHHLAERWIEEVNDRGQSAFYPGFYVFQG